MLLPPSGLQLQPPPVLPHAPRHDPDGCSQGPPGSQTALALAAPLAASASLVPLVPSLGALGPRLAASSPGAGSTAVPTSSASAPLGQSQVDVRSLPAGSGARATGRRRARASSAPRTPFQAGTSVDVAASPFADSKGKGSKYLKLGHGPWAAAFLKMPPPTPTSGAARARAGLAAVNLTQARTRELQRERAARALVSILPYGSAPFIMHDPPEVIDAADPAEVAERLVASLSTYGVGSLQQAYGSLGALKEWAALNKPGVTITGSVYADFLAAQPAKSRDRLLGGFTWLADWCGIDTPARAPVMRPFKQGAPSSVNDKESFGVFIVFGLQWIARYHSSEYVRGHAAAWAFMALCALRFEQAQALTINGFVTYTYRGESFTLVAAATSHDKNPDAAKIRPRPVWGVISGFLDEGAVRDALTSMLQGAEGVCCTLRETDSPDGSPLTASDWVSAGVASRGRADASLHALLQLEPISLTAEQAARYHGHSAKRFLLNAAEASDEFDETAAHAVGRFSGSTAQDPDLEPVEAMLVKHALTCSVLPAIYGGKAKVATAFDRLAKLHCVLRRIVRRHLSELAPLPREGGWSAEFFHSS